MSGMKVNFDKSEVFTVGLIETEQQTVAASFRCKLGAFPMKYLGMPVSDCKISKAHLRYVSDKTEKRLSTWQYEYLSSRGKSILIDSCLSSVPMYTMGVYQLYEGNFQALDTIRSRFFWQGTVRRESTI
jgi:hypothetical protein